MMQNLPDWLEKTIEGLGFELVDINQSQGKRHIQVFIDKPEGVTVDDCAFVSNHLTRLFMVENVDYDRLEISSPGLDRVVRKPEDFVRFAGREVKIKIKIPMDELGKQKQMTALLKGFEDGAILLEVEGNPLKLPLSNLDKARLVPQI